MAIEIRATRTPLQKTKYGYKYDLSKYERKYKIQHYDIIWHSSYFDHYLAAFLGRPKVVLVAVGAPGFNTAGLQLFQWAVINRGVPDV